MREAEQHANGDQNIDGGTQKPRAAPVLQFSSTAICWLWHTATSIRTASPEPSAPRSAPFRAPPSTESSDGKSCNGIGTARHRRGTRGHSPIAEHTAFPCRLCPVPPVPEKHGAGFGTDSGPTAPRFPRGRAHPPRGDKALPPGPHLPPPPPPSTASPALPRTRARPYRRRTPSAAPAGPHLPPRSAPRRGALPAPSRAAPAPPPPPPNSGPPPAEAAPLSRPAGSERRPGPPPPPAGSAEPSGGPEPPLAAGGRGPGSPGSRRGAGEGSAGSFVSLLGPARRCPEEPARSSRWLRCRAAPRGPRKRGTASRERIKRRYLRPQSGPEPAGRRRRRGNGRAAQSPPHAAAIRR
ncbi:basic proline-rich protein-like [Cyrtonyx montezumae]|uniref:basic proline-rich protein-like n=1 Tax=Cyrtonyx montezumae TaxID=9017 RepID=UPI0032DA5051